MRWEPHQLRAAFARRLSELFGRDVPAYPTLLAATREVNLRVLGSQGARAERLGDLSRVGDERHGAIRVGTPRELSQVGRIFAAMGMYPVGFYDLREAATRAVPVVATAFRPLDPPELARGPFRVFTSMLVPGDRRFFTADLGRRLDHALADRTLFPPLLLDLADRAIAWHGLDPADAESFLALATDALRLSPEPVDRAWFTELSRVCAVAADIGAGRTTHLNHLTPRVLDIDELYAVMRGRGLEMIDTIQGPPRWAGPDLLLRQTSMRALAEHRPFREPDGTITHGTVRVRFGEVESRGIAATVRGHALYDELTAKVEETVADATRSAPVPAPERARLAAELWNRRVPASEAALAQHDLAYFTYTVEPDGRHPGGPPPLTLPDLLDQGWIRAEPIVYEDFLPRSAAGIFQSNLDTAGRRDAAAPGTELDAAWLAGALGRPLHDPHTLYDRLRRDSVARVAEQLGLPGRLLPVTVSPGDDAP